jgi:hypothetical protein
MREKIHALKEKQSYMLYCETSWEWIVEKLQPLRNKTKWQKKKTQKMNSWWWQQCTKVFSLWIWLRNLFNFGVKSIKLKQKQVLMRREKVEREESIYAYDCKVKLWCKGKNFIKIQKLIQQKPKQPCALRGQIS